MAVRRELAAGVDVDVVNGRAENGDGGNTALWFAAQGPWPNGVDVARVLIEAKHGWQKDGGRKIRAGGNLPASIFLPASLILRALAKQDCIRYCRRVMIDGC